MHECYFIYILHVCFVLFTPSTVVFLRLNGNVILYHGFLCISDIGYTDDTALLCITNHPPPTNSTTSGGNWFVPNGTRVPNEGVPGFVRNRDPMVVRLKRNTATGTAAEGIYDCGVKDNTESNRTVYVGLYNEGGMYWFTECSLCN